MASGKKMAMSRHHALAARLLAVFALSDRMREHLLTSAGVQGLQAWDRRLSRIHAV
jgi:hypothetical protein